MIARIVVALLLTLAGLLATSCERAQTPVTPPDAAGPPSGDIARPKVWCPDDSYLEWLYNEPADYEYEIAFRGTVDVAAGGALSGFPLTWGMGYWFQMVVPPGAMVVPEGTTSVTITCYVPVMGTWFPSVDDPMPLVFEPDGLQFADPVAVTLCFHPHLVPSCDGYTFLSADYQNGVYTSLETYQTGATAQIFDKRAAPPPLAPIQDDPDRCAVGIAAEMNHFSRWALGKENPDGP